MKKLLLTGEELMEHVELRNGKRKNIIRLKKKEEDPYDVITEQELIVMSIM